MDPWIYVSLGGLVLILTRRATRTIRLRVKNEEHLAELNANLERIRHSRGPSEHVLRPPPIPRTEEEIEVDREAYLAQERFFSMIRWNTHLSHAEVARLKRLPIQGLTHKGILKMIEDQSNECFYCVTEVSITAHHKDHLIPLAMWGPNHIDNIVIACSSCNLEKGAKDPLHFIRNSKRQLRDQKQLQRSITQRLPLVRRHVPDWAGELF
jgi:5-methylcytosine-specific restriction endonuclease McrA